MTSTNYEIRFDNFGSGGEDTSSSSSYLLRDSVGGTSSQGSSSSSYQLNSGYRAGIFDRSVDFTLFIQDKSSQVAATSRAGNTVGVTSTAGIAVGDMVVVIQDEGESQVEAIGEVISVAPSDFTVDAFTARTTLPTIDGTNDLVYVLDGSVISLGTLTDSIVATGIIGWEADVETDDGYSVYIYEDTDLNSGGEVIPDVMDGTVTAGDSEYGGRSSDGSLSDSLFDAEDTAFTTSFQQIGSRGGYEFASRDFLTIKAAVNDTQDGGTYSHNLTVIYVGDY